MVVTLASAIAIGWLLAEASVTPRPPEQVLVVVLAPEVQGAVTRNALARIKGELGAVSFRVVEQSLDPNVDVMAQVETASQELSPTATFALAQDPNGEYEGVGVWVSNRITDTTTVQRVPIYAGDVDRAAARLAIQAVELVRASLADLWPQRQPPPPPVVTVAATPSPQSPRHLSLALSMGMIGDLATTTVFWTPQIALSYPLTERTDLRLGVIASSFGGETVAGADGASAQLQRGAFSLGVVHMFRPDRVFRPLVSAGAGAHYLRAEGMVDPSDRARTMTAWSAMLSAGTGLVIAVAPRFAFKLEAQLIYLLPSVLVRLGYDDTARFNQPALFADAGILASF